MKKILCFGDSNTYGYIAGSGQRFDKNTRWTGLLQNLLSNDYTIIEGGLNNRNGFIDSIDGEEQTGYKVLPKYLREKPDIVIIAIGINDTQKFYRPSEETIYNGLKSMIRSIKDINAEIIIVAPPVLNDDTLKGNFSFQFDEISVELSKKLPQLYKNISKETDCHFIDFNNEIKVSRTDGLHYTADSHKLIAEGIYNHIRTL